jgi:hypothetical protein
MEALWGGGMMEYTEQEKRFLEKMGVTPGPWKAEKCTCGHKHCKKYGIDRLMLPADRLSKEDADIISVAPKALCRIVTNLCDPLMYTDFIDREIVEDAFSRPWAEIRQAWIDARVEE